MSIKLCLFDLDNTLLHTNDLEKFRGRNNLGVTSNDYTNELLNSAFGPGLPDRQIYKAEQLASLKNHFPNMLWGVFTRAPRHYAKTLLNHAYPNYTWNIIIGREDVTQTKPHPDGIWRALEATGIKWTNQIALIGDEINDVVCAYRSGCWSFIDQTTWSRPLNQEQWKTLERVPDALFTDCQKLKTIIENPYRHAPELERLIENETTDGQQLRIDKITHFFPKHYGLSGVTIHILGRLFGDHKELEHRRSWHSLTEQIHTHKNSDNFPEIWIKAIHSFIHKDSIYKKKVVVTVIPFKPDRKPRLEALLNQVEETYSSSKNSTQKQTIEFFPDILEFQNGAISSHGNHLSRRERFENIGDNLFVKRQEEIRGKHVVIIDDVVTSGATLLWAHHYLLKSGANKVSCLALTKAIGVN